MIGIFYISLFQQFADDGGTDRYSIFYESLCLNNLHSKFFPIAAVVLKSFAPVVAEPMVIPDKQGLNVELFMQHVHEFLGRETGEFMCKRQHQAVVSLKLFQ